MKIPPLVLLAVLAAPLVVSAQDAPSAVPREPAAPASSPATARILGNIPDGTPPAPRPPKPRFIIPDKDVLATTSHQQGGRTITIQRVKPIALPPPPEPAPVSATIDNAAFQQRLTEFRKSHPKSGTLCLGATVYRLKDAPPRTLVTYWPDGSGESISFWSSADFALIAGISTFVATDGETRNLLMMWSNLDVGRLATRFAAQGRQYHGPNIPEFPDGPATFTFVGAPPAADILVSIQSLHDIYNREYERLKTAWEGRERARIQREADLKANPPQPKDIVLNYWRTDKPAPAKGATK